MQSTINQIKELVNTNRINIYGLSGRAGAGKTTIANYLQSKGCIPITFAEPVKLVTEIIFGFDYEMLLGETPESRVQRETLRDEIWNKTPREALEYIGTDLFRDCFDNKIWIKIALRKILEESKKNPDKKINFIITDCRFVNEIDVIKSLGGKICFIYREENDLIVTDEDKTTHVSKWQFLTRQVSDDIYIKTFRDSNDTFNGLFTIVESKILN